MGRPESMRILLKGAWPNLKLVCVSALILVWALAIGQTGTDTSRAVMLAAVQGKLVEYRFTEGSALPGRKVKIPVSSISEVSAVQGKFIAVTSGKRLLMFNMRTQPWTKVMEVAVPSDVFRIQISPKLDRIAYSLIRKVDGRVMPSIIGDIAVIGIASRRTQIVAKNVELTLGFAWKTDGRALLICSAQRSGRKPDSGSELVTMEPGKSGWVASGYRDGYSPRLSLDGKANYFIRYTKNEAYLYRLDPAGKETRILTEARLVSRLAGVIGKDRYVVASFGSPDGRDEFVVVDGSGKGAVRAQWANYGVAQLSREVGR